MMFRHWLRGTAALAFVAGLAGSAAGQSKLQMSLEEAQIFSDIRDNKRALVKDPNAQQAQKNVDAIKRKAQVEVARMLDAAATPGGSSESNRISLIVRGLNEIIIDPINRGGTRLSEGQRDMVAIFGKEMTDQLRKIVGTQKEPSGADILVKVNAARMLSILAKSGYDGVAELAVDVVTDPKQSDAIKLYMFEALHNLLAVPNPDKEGRSMIADAALELRVVQALIGYIARKLDLSAGVPKDEVDATRYVRREAVRALGHVRRSIFRNSNGGVEAVPGIWLLRVANADQSLAPTPSLSERVEALVGYLNLQADKDQNMDFAAGYIAKAIEDLTREYLETQPLNKPRADDKKPPERMPEERDMLPWKLTGTRIQLGMKAWRDNWEIPALGARPAEVRKMMTDLIAAVDKNILEFMALGSRRDEVRGEPLKDWLKNTKFTSESLYNDTKDATILRPDTAR